MKTLGFELVDAGSEVAMARAAAADASAQAERLSPSGAVPAVALVEENDLRVGLDAEARRFLFPRQINETFWEELSLQPSNLRRGGRALSHSELAYHFLRHVVDTLPGVAAQHETAVLALPVTFLDAGEKGDERIGILLGICRDLELRLGAIVDAACAALLDPETTAPSRGAAVVVDLSLHAAVLTLLDVDGAVTRRTFLRIPGAGWLALVESARRALGDRFLRQTAFDVTADRRTEQEFHDETLEALTTFTTQPEAWLRITSASRERAMSAPRDGLAGDLRSLSETVAQGVVDLLHRNGRAPSNVQVYLTARARQLCGLATALRSRGALSVTVLNAGAAARGAATLACQRPALADLAEISIESSVPLAPTAASAAMNLRAAFSFVRHDGRRETGPTHVVYDGLAHALRAEGTRVAAGLAAQTAVASVPVAPTGVGPCEVVIEARNGRWQVAAEAEGRRLEVPGGDTPLAAGDVLELHGPSGAARLSFVRVTA